MELAIVGLPGSGKSQLYRLLAKKEVLPHPKKGGELHLATVDLPDERLEALGALLKPERLTPIKMTFLDWQGEQVMEEGIPVVENLLKALRNANGLVVVLKGFAAVGEGAVPWQDWKRFQEELLLKDLIIAESRLEKLKRLVKVERTEEHEREFSLLTKCHEQLQGERKLRDLHLSSLEEKLLRGFQFLSVKPQVTVVNLDDEGFEQGGFGIPEELKSLVPRPVRMSLKTECEIALMPQSDREAFLPLLGERGSAVGEFLDCVRLSLGLIRFYTVKGPEVRAWAIPEGSAAREAAGAIHTDMERGFIRAEVINWSDLLDAGSMAVAREKGKLKLEGKDYVVQDGDVLQIKFSV